MDTSWLFKPTNNKSIQPDDQKTILNIQILQNTSIRNRLLLPKHFHYSHI